jgi:hypothetical protein
MKPKARKVPKKQRAETKADIDDQSSLRPLEKERTCLDDSCHVAVVLILSSRELIVVVSKIPSQCLTRYRRREDCISSIDGSATAHTNPTHVYPPHPIHRNRSRCRLPLPQFRSCLPTNNTRVSTTTTTMVSPSPSSHDRCLKAKY